MHKRKESLQHDSFSLSHHRLSLKLSCMLHRKDRYYLLKNLSTTIGNKKNSISDIFKGKKFLDEATAHGLHFLTGGGPLSNPPSISSQFHATQRNYKIQVTVLLSTTNKYSASYKARNRNPVTSLQIQRYRVFQT